MAEGNWLTGETLLRHLQALTPEQRTLPVVVKARDDVGYATRNRVTVAQCDDNGRIVEDDDEAPKKYSGGPVLLIKID